MQSENVERKGAPARYVTALGFPILTRFYDAVLRTTMRERAFKAELIGQAGIQAGHRVLDLGCGTATLSISIKLAHPDATVFGLDGDPKILAIAADKVKAAGANVELRHGLSFELPFEPASFDRVVSSLVFHHLLLEDKRRTFRAVREVLRPGGELHIADWGEAQNAAMRAAFLSIQLLDGFETTQDNVRGRIPALMREAGFIGVEETERRMTIFGTLAFYRGEAP